MLVSKLSDTIRVRQTTPMSYVKTSKCDINSEAVSHVDDIDCQGLERQQKQQ